MGRKTPARVVALMVVVAIVVTGIVVYLDMGGAPQLITKDPSEMVLTLNDLPSDYALFDESQFTSPQEAENKLYLENGSLWQEWGFEVYHRKSFYRTGVYYDHVDSGVYRFSNIEGAKAFYNSEYERFSGSGAVLPTPEIICDESFAVGFTLGLLDNIWTYGICFRERNVFAWVAVNYEGSTLNDAIPYARIVEGRIS